MRVMLCLVAGLKMPPVIESEERKMGAEELVVITHSNQVQFLNYFLMF